jgi:transposase
MPIRPFNREQTWLLPPTLGELIPDDHPARFVAEFVDTLEREVWAELGIGLDGEALGAPAYHPRVLLSVWLYGFMTGIRSCRKLETACRDQVPYLWLTGWQYPDHNTLWRFYQTHREPMRRLLKHTVAIAVELGLTDLAVQALDGTRISANAAGDRTHNTGELRRLLDRVDAAITLLEAQNEGGDDPLQPRLPKELQKAQLLRQQIKEAMSRLEHQGLSKINLTDSDAQLVKARSGVIIGYNAQAMVSPVNPSVAEGSGMLITAAEVVNSAADSGQLIPMLEQAEEITGTRSPVTLADGGYHTAANLMAGKERGQTLVMAERYQAEVRDPYFKDQFRYNTADDCYICPHGQQLSFRGIRKSPKSGSRLIRVYRARRAACRACPAYGTCTKDKHCGRALWIGPSDRLLRQHRQWMLTDVAKKLYTRRKILCEPTFGILKDQQGARRFLLRGIANVQAEFTLLATAFNLRTLWRILRSPQKVFRSTCVIVPA